MAIHRLVSIPAPVLLVSAFVVSSIILASIWPNAAAYAQSREMPERPALQENIPGNAAQSPAEGRHSRSREMFASIHRRLSRAEVRAQREFARASAAFPDFCQDWGQKLAQRQRDNRRNITWKKRDGYETGTFLGYGPILSCTCKHSREGVPVGKLTYREFTYYLVGRTVEDALQSKPHLIPSSDTTEIFAWNHGRWFY